MLTLLVACSSKDDAGPDGVDPSETGTEDPTGPTGGACGELSYFDTHVIGRVEDEAHQPIAGAQVHLEERNWAPGTVHGSTTSDGYGGLDFDVTELPVVEDCWGTAVSYWLVGEATGVDGHLIGEKPMNSPLIDAYLNGGIVEFTYFPLVLRLE